MVHIYTACTNKTTKREPMGYMHSSRVYESIYNIKNMYNNFIILQDFSSVNMFFYGF